MAKTADEQRNEIIRQFYVTIVRRIEYDVDDGIYDEIDQDLLDGVDFNNIVEVCSFQGVRKVISEGLKAIYGIDIGMEDDHEEESQDKNKEMILWESQDTGSSAPRSTGCGSTRPARRERRRTGLTPCSNIQLGSAFWAP